MILEHIHKKIESTKFLIQRDNLIIPSDTKREIAHIVTNKISKYKESKPKLLRKLIYKTNKYTKLFH